MLIFKRSEQLTNTAKQIYIPIIDGKVAAGEYGKFFNIDLQEQLAFFVTAEKPIKAGEIYEVPTKINKYACERIALVSLGKASDQELRTAGAAIGRKLRNKNETVFLALTLKSNQFKSLLISANLGNFQWSLKREQKSSITQVCVPTDDGVVKSAQVISDAVNRARELIHTPSNIKSPEWLAKQAKRFANGAKVEVLSGTALKEFGGLLAVGGSSPKPGPRFIKMAYSPRKSGVKHVVLVGKGITYDTGGISLKRPYEIMAPMKSDMAGVATCLSVISALRDLKPDVKVTALLMCAENSISATAQRPSDVITHYGGKTVEVINTDAEGRLVLADGLAYAVKNLKPDYLIDIATLTGSATLGLGKQYAAMYSRDLKFVNQLKQAGEQSGDRVWHMPLVDDYVPALDSDIADLNHTADKYNFNGGSITAALFLEQFVDGATWAHLDIAGVGRSETDAGENPKGGTGWGVRLLLQWIGSLK